MGTFTSKEIELLKNAGINARSDMEYTSEERKNICMNVTGFIMSHSIKNGDIDKLQKEYMTILEKTVIK